MNQGESNFYTIHDDIRELCCQNITRLFCNETRMGINKKITKNFHRCLSSINQYPDPNCFRLKEMVSKKTNIAKECIIFGNGSTELLDLITQVIVNKGCEVIVSQYAYPLYESLVVKYQGEVLSIPTISWDYDLTQMINSLSIRTKAIFLANPNNPTGCWVFFEKLHTFISRVPPHVFIIIDEAYFEYMEDVPLYASAIGLINKFSNVIVTRTFSKAYGLAGLRLGYAVAAPEFIKKIKGRKQAANVNSVAQYAAEIVYSDFDYKRKIINSTKRNNQFIQNKLAYLGIGYKETEANFIMINTYQDSFLAYKKMLLAGFVVQPIRINLINQYIRVSIGCLLDMERFVRVLPKIIRMT